MYVVFIGWRCGYTWKDLEEFSAEKVKAAAPANSVLIAVGFLLGAWMFSGTIPMFIYYGVQLVSAKWILVSAFILCAIFSTCTGTSWGSAATAGITMMGIAMAMPNVNIAAVAGACYTGAIFGDKLSRYLTRRFWHLFATKNDIFDHIKNMSKTVVPGGLIDWSFTRSWASKRDAGAAGLPENTPCALDALDGAFKWNVIVLLPMVLFDFTAVSPKKPSTVIMMLSAVLALLIGVFLPGFQPGGRNHSPYSGFNLEMVEGARSGFVAAEAGDDAMALLNRGGLASMMKSFITVYICLYFAAIMEHIGAIEALLGKTAAVLKTRFSLVFVTFYFLCSSDGDRRKFDTGVDSHRRNVFGEVQRDGTVHLESVQNHGGLLYRYGWVHSLVGFRHLLSVCTGRADRTILPILLHELRHLDSGILLQHYGNLHETA